MHQTLAKKVFAVGLAASTVLWGLAPLAAQAAAHAAGTNVSTSDGTVYMIMSDGTRRPYTSAGAFLSYGFNSFASVVTANADDLALPVGPFIPPQDGKIICSDRGADKGTCYLITEGKKAGFVSAAVFTGLGFSFSRVGYGDVSWMSSAANIESSTEAHRPGVLVNNAGTVQLVGTSGLMGIPDLATFNSWGYSFADVVPANTADKAMTQTGVMAARVPGQLSPTTVVTPPSSGPLAVGLAADNPASQTLVTGQYGAVLAKFTFTGNGTVNAVQLQRIGVSADTTLSNVYLYDGATRLTDAATVSSGGVINFSSTSGLFMVSGSKTISVVAEIATGTSGQTVGVKINSYTPAGGSATAVSAQGNLHTIASATLADVTYGTVTPSGGTQDPAPDVVVWQSTLTVITRDVVLSRMALRQIGTVNSSDIQNFRLLVDGAQVAQTQSLDSNGYVTFNLAAPKTLTTGSRTVKVLADILGGASRTFQFSLRTKSDILLTDSSYGVGVGSSSTFPIGSASANTISGSGGGTLTVQKASDSPSDPVTAGSSDAALAKFTFTAYGESFKVETLNVTATTSDTSVASLRNGRIMVGGSQVGSNTTLGTIAGSVSGTSFTTNFTVNPGTPVTVEIRADIYDNDGTNNLSSGDTITIGLAAGSSNAQKLTSLGYTNVPSSATSGNTITVSSGALTLAKSTTYVNQTTVVPKSSGYKVGEFTISNSNVEDVNIDTLNLGVDPVSGSTFTAADLTDVYMKVNGQNTAPKSTISSTSTLYSVNYTLPKNTTWKIEIWANIGSTITSGDSMRTILTVSGTAALSGNAVTSGAQAGQTIASGTGTFTATVDASRPDASLLDDSGTKTVAAFKLDAVTDDFTLTDVTLSFQSNRTTIANVILKEGGSVLASKPASSASTTFTGLSLSVPANTSKVLTVDLELSTVGVGAGTSGENVTVQLHSATGKNSQGVSAALSGSFALSGQAQYVYKSVPTITPVSLPTGILSQGTITLAKFSISSGGTGAVSWGYLTLTVTKSDSNATITNPTLWDADTNTQISLATSTVTNLATGSTSGTIALGTTNEQQISGAKTYEVRVDYTDSSLVSGDSVNSKIAQGASSYAAPAAFLTVLGAQGATASFIWSDVSASSHSTTTTDWNNSYLVKNLPTNSQSLTR